MPANAAASLTDKKCRDYGFDNVKFILMFCVIVGHILEWITADGQQQLYRFLYLFHMPVFIFISGYFARAGKPGNILRQFSIYVVFQTLYLIFDRIVLGNDTQLQYTVPYYAFWYILALLFYTILLPLYDVDSASKRVLAVLICFLIALLAGYDDSLGSMLELSRFFVFQPYYLMGLYFRRLEQEHDFRPRWILCAIIGVAATAFLTYCVMQSDISARMMYGTYSYSALEYGIGQRGILALTAVLWIFLFVFVVKPLLNFRIPLVTTIVANTLPIYLLHIFVMKLGHALRPEFMNSYFAVIALTLACLLLFGNPPVARLFRLLFDRKH